MNEQTNGRVGTLVGFILGWLLGALAGAMTALLLAPQSGAETQKQIIRQAEAAKDEADRALEQSKRNAEGKVAQARTAFSDRLRQGAAILEP
ncbi:MAG: YtxH domain-containing protein [Anaerolineales bacterium]